MEVRFMKARCLTTLLLLAVILTGCSQEQALLPPAEATMPPEPMEQIHETPHLMISVEPEDIAFYRVSEDFPADLTDFNIFYTGVSNVMITLDSMQLSLEDALTSGRITPEEIIAYAQLDAKNGFCYEYATSTNGLTKLVYNYYDQFDLVVFYDIYETPDGKQHLIKELHFCPYYDGRRISFRFGDIDREDWGLTIQSADISPDGLNLVISQSGGQQLGDLYIIDYAISSITEQRTLTNTNGNISVNLPNSPEYQIQMNKESTIRINLAEHYGTLPSGDYTIWLGVLDVYDETKVHPLMKNFQDLQGFYVSFTIP